MAPQRKDRPALSGKVGQLLETIDVLPLEDDSDQKYGEIRTALEKAGTSIGANDYLIAAHTLSLGFTLVTDNVGEFSGIAGLKVENWLET